MFNQWQVDFYQVMLRIVAWFYRTPIFSAILKVNSQPMNFINTQFANFKAQVDYMLSFNAQIVYLEKFLNNMFNIPYAPATRTADIASHIIIWINSPNKYANSLWNKAELQAPVYLFNKSETKPPFYIANLSEYYASNSFTVNIPVAVPFNQNIVRSAINTYNLASKRFVIQNY